MSSACNITTYVKLIMPVNWYEFHNYFRNIYIIIHDLTIKLVRWEGCQAYDLLVTCKESELQLPIIGQWIRFYTTRLQVRVLLHLIQFKKSDGRANCYTTVFPTVTISIYSLSCDENLDE